MTDTSAWLIGQELPASTRATLLGSLFGAGGIHLAFVGVPVGGGGLHQERAALFLR